MLFHEVRFYKMKLQIVAKWVLHYKVGRTTLLPDVLLFLIIRLKTFKTIYYENKRFQFRNGKSRKTSIP